MKSKAKASSAPPRAAQPLTPTTQRFAIVGEAECGSLLIAAATDEGLPFGAIFTVGPSDPDGFLEAVALRAFH